MATEKQRRTFISYSRVNEAFAVKLAVELKLAGYTVWLDQLDIPTGARWDDEIEKALRDCGIFLAILTPAFIASENAKDEIGYAIDHGKRILPVLLQECEIPFRLRRFQYIDFTRMSYGEGVKHAKEMLAKLVKEESIPRPAAIHQEETSIINKVGETTGKERPTRPTGSRLSQPISDHAHIPNMIAGKSKKSPFQRSSLLFGIAFFAVLIFIAVLNFGPKLFSFINQTPTSTTTQEIKPIDTFTPAIVAATDTPTSRLHHSCTEEFDTNIGWGENWGRLIKHGNERRIEFSIENGVANWRLNDKYLSVYYFYKEFFKYNSSVQLDIEFKNLVFLNSKITDPEISSFSLICGYSEEGWYEVNFNGGYYKIIRRVGYQQTISVPINGGVKEWKFGDNVNKVTVTCKSDEISIFANDGKPIIYKLGANEVKLSEGQVGIALTADKDFPVSVQILSIKVSEP